MTKEQFQNLKSGDLLKLRTLDGFPPTMTVLEITKYATSALKKAELIKVGWFDTKKIFQTMDIPIQAASAFNLLET